MNTKDNQESSSLIMLGGQKREWLVSLLNQNVLKMFVVMCKLKISFPIVAHRLNTCLSILRSRVQAQLAPEEIIWVISQLVFRSSPTVSKPGARATGQLIFQKNSNFAPKMFSRIGPFLKSSIHIYVSDTLHLGPIWKNCL